MMTEETNVETTPATIPEATTAPEVVQGTTQVNFRDLLPDEYKNMYPEFKKPEDFVKSYDELYRKMGSAINKPKEDAPKEDWDKFYNKLGRPEAPDKYELDLGEDIKVDEDFLNKFKNKAYETGVTQKQAKEMLDWYNKETSEFEARYAKEQEEAQAKAIADLKVRWGAKYEDKLKEVQGFAKELIGSEQGFEKLSKYGNDPEFINLLDNLKNRYAKEDYIQPNNPAYYDKPDLLSEAKKLMADEDYKFNEDKQIRVRKMFQEIARQREESGKK